MPEDVLEFSETLLESASPELYRSNAFRVLGLPAYASDKQIDDRANEILGSIRLGIPIEEGGCLNISPSPGENEVRNATQRLRNPERRLIDELFWLWPLRFNDYDNDEALSALKSKKYNGAKNIWADHVADAKDMEGMISAHNLAVLAHTMALDLEFDYLKNKPTLTDQAKKLELWQDAYKWWSVCLDKDRLMLTWLERRINDLDYPNLTVEAAKKIKDTIPGGLININVLLAIRAGEKGEEYQVDQNIQLIKNNIGFINGIAEKSLRDTIDSIKDYIKKLSITSIEEAKRSPERGEEIALDLIEKTKTHLRLLDTVLSRKNAIRVDAHDMIANRLIDTMIIFANKTYNWDVCLDLLKKAKLIAEGDTANNRIENEMRTVNQNIELSKATLPYGAPEMPSESYIDKSGQVLYKVNRYKKIGRIVGGIGGLALAMTMESGWLAGIFYIIMGYIVGKWIFGKMAAFGS